MSGECRFTDYGEDGLLCETHGLAVMYVCSDAAAALRGELALARDTAFWLDCRWKEPSDEPRGANVCRLEGTKVCALCTLADADAKVEKLQRYPFEPICLNCGALKPCMTEADLKPGDPGVPCTFDPTPKQLFEENAALRASIDAWKATSDALDAERTGYRLRAEMAEATAERLLEVIVMGIFPPRLDG